MRKINDKTLRDLEFDILKDVASFCEDNKLRYYLCGGTLLGCVRHGGFIPWDDDIDIIMPRPDYIKFMKSYNLRKSNYRVNSLFTNPNFDSTFAEVEDIRTLKIYNGFKQEQQRGVNIDVFPTDGSPNKRYNRKIFWIVNNLISRFGVLAQMKFTKSKHFADQDTSFNIFRTGIRTGLKFFAIPLARVAKLFINFNWAVTKRAMKYDVDKSEYIGVSTFPHYGYGECVKGSSFLKITKRPFEGILFSTPDNYDEYLSNLYGDYMKMQPKEKQVTHHDFVAYWKE